MYLNHKSGITVMEINNGLGVHPSLIDLATGITVVTPPFNITHDTTPSPNFLYI